MDRMLILLSDAPSLRDLIMFPSQRPESGSDTEQEADMMGDDG